MFVQNLNIKQQSVLLYLAKEIAKADGVLHESQIQLMTILKDQSDKDAIELAVSLEELPAIFDSERVKCSLLLELIGVANANQDYHLNEKGLISKYAQALKVSDSKLNKLNDWVQSQIELMKQAQDLLD